MKSSKGTGTKTINNNVEIFLLGNYLVLLGTLVVVRNVSDVGRYVGEVYE